MVSDDGGTPRRGRYAGRGRPSRRALAARLLEGAVRPPQPRLRRRLTGDFRVVGDRVVAHLDGARPTDPALQYTWSIFRGRLKLGPVEGSPVAAQVVAKPLTRVE